MSEIEQTEVSNVANDVAAHFVVDQLFNELTLADKVALRQLEINRRLSEQNEQIMHEAHHDELTSLPNRRYMSAFIRRFAEEAPEDHSAVVLLVDLDKFKEVNDTWGHVKGDEALKILARRLQGVVRHREGVFDCVARIGGDEFMLLFHLADQDYDAGDLQELFEMFQGRINNQLEFDIDDTQKVVYQASVGMQYFTVHQLRYLGGDIDEIKAGADEQLYRNKQREGDHSPLVVQKHSPFSVGAMIDSAPLDASADM